MAETFKAAEWATFNEVKNAMAEAENELSTDEDEAEILDRQELLQAAEARMRRDGQAGVAPVQTGTESCDFNARASSIFGQIGGGAQEHAPLRFWTSIHAGIAPGATSADAEMTDVSEIEAPRSDSRPARPQDGGAREWLDDLDDLSDGDEESDLEEAEGDPSLRGRDATTRKRAHGEQQQQSMVGSGEQQRTKQRPRPSTVVTFGPEVIIPPHAADVGEDGAQGAPAPRADALASAEHASPPPAVAQRAGYTHYSLEDVDADAGANRKAMADALDAVRKLQG
jgi:hypothetical protein